MEEQGIQIVFVIIFAALGSLFSIVIPATCITSEKEARSWPLLMATTLSSSQILYAKFVGVIRRTLPSWILLFVHVIFFSLLRVIHPVAIFQLAVPVACIILLSSVTGIYFSSRFKRTTTAVIMNLAFAISIWALIPLLTFLFVMTIGPGDGEKIIIPQLIINPFVHLVVIIEATTGRPSSLSLESIRYHWPHGGEQFVDTNYVLLVTTVIYFGIAALFAYRAARRFRQNIF
jgi:ABC-type transport system involved in multi-copper enzyme maturation permease subunit